MRYLWGLLVWCLKPENSERNKTINAVRSLIIEAAKARCAKVAINTKTNELKATQKSTVKDGRLARAVLIPAERALYALLI